MMTSEQYNILLAQCAPHPVFSNDWLTFTDKEFADALLPDVGLVKGTNLYFFDGAELLPKGCRFSKRLMRLPDGKAPLLTMYSYPKDVMAAQRRERVVPSENEICVFFELEKDEFIHLYWTLGEGVQKFGISSSNYRKTTLSDFYNFYKNEFSHFKVLQYLNFSTDYKDDNTSITDSISIHISDVILFESIMDRKFLEVSIKTDGFLLKSYELTVKYKSQKIFNSLRQHPKTASSSDKYIFIERLNYDKTTGVFFELEIGVEATSEKGQHYSASRKVKLLDLLANVQKYAILLDENDNEIIITRDDIIERQKKFISKIPADFRRKMSNEANLILNLPIIMAKLNWPYSALCQIHWLEGSGKSLKLPYDFFVSEKRVFDIDVINLKEYLHDVKYLSEKDMFTKSKKQTNECLFNISIPRVELSYEKFMKILQERTILNGEYYQVGNYNNLATEDNKLWDKYSHERKVMYSKENFFQSFSTGSKYGDFDDVGASVGLFSQRCYFRGVINNINNELSLSLDELGIRFTDSFSFNGWQFLGSWYNITDKVVPPKQYDDSRAATPLYNSSFRELRNNLSKLLSNCCEDFFIYSPIRIYSIEKLFENEHKKMEINL